MNETEIEITGIDLIDRGKRFSFVDALIVCVGIGFLASVALPIVQQVRVNAQNAQFASDIGIFRVALNDFKAKHGDYFPFDSNPGELDASMTGYIDVAQFESLPSIGGQWDIELNKNGVVSAVGVYNPSASHEQLVRIDEMLDDGDIANGNLRFIDKHSYAWVLEES